MAEKFAGKVALVAGGTGGLGRAMSLAFLAQGATVVATYRRQDEWDALQKTAAANRQNLSGLSVDVTDESAVATLAGNLVAKFGRLDALVNSVGAYAGGVKLWELDAKVWDQMFALNLRSDFVLARAAVPQMLKQREGSIVNIASKAAVGHAAGAAAYAASKAAAVAMIDSLAADLKGTGVRANSILPSIIDTEANRKAMPGADFAKWPKPEDIARVVLMQRRRETHARRIAAGLRGQLKQLPGDLRSGAFLRNMTSDIADSLHILSLRARRIALRILALVVVCLSIHVLARAGQPGSRLPPSQSPQSALIIVHVAIIDVLTGTVQRDASVVIEGDHIAQVGAAHTVKIPKGARVVDATGKFLIPGLWDMHVHTFFGEQAPAGRGVTLPLFVANGITGVRDMGSELEAVLQARAEIAGGKILGPRMIVAGPMLDGPKTQFPASIAITTPEDGRRAVDMLVSRGVDFIKIQSYVPRDAYFAIVDECKKKNITFVGHVPDAIRGAEASNAGQKSFEHLIGIFEGSSTAEDELLKGSKGPGKFLDTYDAQREAALIALLAKNQTWQCPTLFWERGQWLVDAIDVTKDPDAKYVPASWRDQLWPRFTKSIVKEMDTDPLSVREKFVEHELDIVRKLRAAGVPFLAGTDTPAGVDVIPGFSLHLELQRFVDAGFAPLQALQTATINPARFLGKTADFGTVEKGKMADLVLLDANPLVDIHNTQKIAGAVLAGRYLSRADLNGILSSVEQFAAQKSLEPRGTAHTQ